MSDTLEIEIDDLIPAQSLCALAIGPLELLHVNARHRERMQEQMRYKIDWMSKAAQAYQEIEHLERERDEAKERVAKLEAEVKAWKTAADNGAGCDTPEGLAAFIHCCNC